MEVQWMSPFLLRIERTQILRHDMTVEKQDGPESLILRALGHAAVDGQVGSKRFHYPLSHLLRMNPSADPIMLKPQELRDPAPLGRDGPRTHPPHFATGFLLLKELHSLLSAP